MKAEERERVKAKGFGFIPLKTKKLTNETPKVYSETTSLEEIEVLKVKKHHEKIDAISFRRMRKGIK